MTAFISAVVNARTVMRNDLVLIDGRYYTVVNLFRTDPGGKSLLLDNGVVYHLEPKSTLKARRKQVYPSR